MGEINLTQEMYATLAGLSINDQSKHFAVLRSEHKESYSYGELDFKKDKEYEETPEKCYNAQSWIVKEGMIVGIVFKGTWGLKNAFLNQWVETYFTVDDDGTGSDEVSVACSLIWKD